MLLLLHSSDLSLDAAMKSMKYHLKQVVSQQKLTFEEFSTLLCQVEACMNSHPILLLNTHSVDGIEVLTPGHIVKWKTPSRNIQPGDVVLKEDCLMPTQWQVAKILTTSPGRDGYTQVVNLKTKMGLYKHPVNKLVLLVLSE